MRVRSLLPIHACAAIAGILFLALAPALPAADEAALWAALRDGGHAALLRHAIAPGTGDPAAFALRDCATQRNLSREGRSQAARIGDRFRAQGIPSARVYSSQWCRCLETARLLALGPVEELPMLNSFFRHYQRRDIQTEELAAWLQNQPLAGPVVLVTHQVNISALTGVYPAEGTLVIVRPSASDRLIVVGTITAD